MSPLVQYRYLQESKFLIRSLGEHSFSPEVRGQLAVNFHGGINGGLGKGTGSGSADPD